MIRRSFVLATAGLVLLPARGFAADTVSGRFVGNGKEAKLAFASAWPRDPFSGKETIIIVLTEKDQSASKRPWFDAGFGKLGAALTFSLTRPDVRLVGTEVAHPGLKRSPLSVSGSIKSEGVSITADRVEGRFFTEKPSTFFDDTYELDVKVAAAIRPRPA
ncbi:MAG: hypothetical protein KF889_03035 [Alphaproteobacteria bacterium]|nr:hypothetical protein [Alphaproteobacteria bacterium]MCW5741884.1 hypothetical protein [Alphaproteobacteria bacterium]